VQPSITNIVCTSLTRFLLVRMNKLTRVDLVVASVIFIITCRSRLTPTSVSNAEDGPASRSTYIFFLFFFPSPPFFSFFSPDRISSRSLISSKGRRPIGPVMCRPPPPYDWYGRSQVIIAGARLFLSISFVFLFLLFDLFRCSDFIMVVFVGIFSILVLASLHLISLVI
jgi:hypothetical protein